MKKLFKSKLILQIVMACAVATLATIGIVGATTIGTNITTTGTLGAATTTISSGDLVVDTNVLIVKYLENRVGIGTTTPTWILSVTGTASQLALAYDNAGYALFDVDASDDLTITASGGEISFGDENVSTTGTFAAGATTITGTLAVTGETSLYGLTSGNGTLASTTTASAGTLTQADLLANSYLDVLSNTAIAFALTLPATSTMTTLLPNAGNTREWMIYNASTTAAVVMTITKGAGINLIGVTINDDVIDGGEYSSLKCYRRADTDVDCIISELINVD